MAEQRGLLAAAGLGVLGLVALGFGIGHWTSGEPSPSPSAALSCSGGDDTAMLQAALDTAGHSPGSTVQIGAGTCALSAALKLNKPYPVIVSGAGPALTHLVQHSRHGVFGIGTPGTTVEHLDLNTAQFNTTYPPLLKDPDPAVIYSAVSNTHVLDVSGEAGTGYGLRIVGPQPCGSDVTSGTVVSGVTLTTGGVGGFAALDISCSRNVQLSGITITGGILAIYRDRNVTLNGETYHHSVHAGPCQPAWVNNSSPGVTLSNVLSYAGWGRTVGIGGVTVVNSETLAPGDSCPVGG